MSSRPILQAAKRLLQEARQEGFSSVRLIGDRSLEGSANSGRTLDFEDRLASITFGGPAGVRSQSGEAGRQR